VKSISKIYGYARCSTSESKQDIERQIRELRKMGATEIFQEYEKGVAIKRPKYQMLISSLSEGDTIICTEVSRLTRDLRQLCEFLEICTQKKIKLILGALALDCGADTPDAMKIAMLQIMGVFAEYERKVTVERIYSGLANAKEKGAKFGRPKMTAASVPDEVKKHWKDYKSGKIRKSEYARITGVSRPTMYKYIELLNGM